MIGALPRPVSSAVTAQAHTQAMWRAQPGALMILGRAPGPLPKTGSARGAAFIGMPGVFRAEFWPMQGELGYAFLAAVRLPQAADRSDDAELILRGARGADRDLRLPLVSASGEVDFGKHVAAKAGAYAARIARFMLDVIRSDDDGDTGQPSAVFAEFLNHAARREGCIELIMHIPQRCVLLQGWGIPPTEPVDLLLPGSSLSRHPLRSGNFARNDIAAPATGIVLVLSPELAGAMVSLERVFLLIGDDLLCRHVVEPRILDVETSIGQLRHLLPRLTCPAPLRALLRASLQPQYEGRDTLNTAGRPVRAALDTAVCIVNESAYLAGWLFDPACHTAELHLCANDVAIRLDENWVRVPRDDVSAAFRADPVFPFSLDEKSGFAVATSIALNSSQQAYLRFTFSDGELAFLPLRFADASAPAVFKALLESVDLHKASGISIIARHLAPFVARMPVGLERSWEILFRGPLDRSRAIVVPLRTTILPRSFIANFLLDAATDLEQIVFVCGPEWDLARRETLIDLIRFYGLPASILGVAHTPRSGDAVLDAAAASQADTFLLVSPGAIGFAAGWREALHCAAPNEHAVCPTVIFEDRSIRFAGPKNIDFPDGAPFVSINTPLAGSSADAVVDAEPVVTAVGTFACCLIRRSALPALVRAARYLTEPGQETAFFLAMKDIALKGMWIPSVRVWAPEDDEALMPPASPLIDGWMLRQTWGEVRSCAF